MILGRPIYKGVFCSHKDRANGVVQSTMCATCLPSFRKIQQHSEKVRSYFFLILLKGIKVEEGLLGKHNRTGRKDGRPGQQKEQRIEERTGKNTDQNIDSAEN